MKAKHIFIIAFLLIVIAVLCVAIVLLSSNESEFIPPEFDESAKEGFPEVEDQSFTRLEDERLQFSINICGKLKITEGKANVYFTNPEENTSNVKLRVMSESGDILYETGLIRPGQYIESIPLDRNQIIGNTLMLKIMAYENQTYHSVGSCVLRAYIE